MGLFRRAGANGHLVTLNDDERVRLSDAYTARRLAEQAASEASIVARAARTHYADVVADVRETRGLPERFDVDFDTGVVTGATPDG